MSEPINRREDTTMRTRRPHYGVSLVASLFALTDATTTAYAADRQPNIVFILTDNRGYGEVGAYGGGLTRGAPTPRIDSLAKDGMRFLNRTPCRRSTISTPTRARRSRRRTHGWSVRF